MSAINLFEYASRNKLRFASVKGEITTEQLWDVPLRSRDDFNLDAVAKNANKVFKVATEESFVNMEPKPEHVRLEVALEVVKYVIAVKIAEEAAATKRAENKAEKEVLLKILAEKQEGKLSNLTEAELRKRIKALDA